MSDGRRTTFSQLLKIGTKIEIPIIQRDYAQGRENVSEIREEFLTTIYDKLCSDPSEHSKPLDLDFVYGSLSGKNGDVFSPLDGQQRLTTLFLLHWYLSCLDEKFEEFQNLILDGDAPRFTYQTRASSKEFFHRLMINKAGSELLASIDANSKTTLSDSITDQQWFYLYWRQDPTVKSALGMLDAIHMKFRKTSGLYDRLVQAENPYVTFQFLDLKEFGLSDDLYIKMNSRGKPLTQFENFKARLEQHVQQMMPDEKITTSGKQVSVKEYLSQKIDQDWADLFWEYRDDKNVFDAQVMNFIRSFTGVFYAQSTEGKVSLSTARHIAEFRESKAEFTFMKYQSYGCLDPSWVRSLITVLDAICEKPGKLKTYLVRSDWYDEKRIFQKSLDQISRYPRSGLEFKESVQFYAYCAYLVEFDGVVDNEALFDWMRLVCNLGENTDFTIEQFRTSIISIKSLVKNANRIYEHIADIDGYKDLKGFYEQQIREEHIKAKLILKSELWKDLIFKAELHEYFKGQVEFLLSFSGVLEYYLANKNCGWNAESDAEYFNLFSTYLDKTSLVFGGTGPDKFPDYLWQRALLAAGDYLLSAKGNECFLHLRNDENAITWKRLLRGALVSKDQSGLNAKRALIKAVLDGLDLNEPESSLRNFIGSTEVNDKWRRMIVERPEIINYCGRRNIRRVSDNNIRLLSKERISASHVELYSFYFMHAFLLPNIHQGKLKPFKNAWSQAVNSEKDDAYVELSGFTISGNNLNWLVFYQDGFYQIQAAFRIDSDIVQKLKQELCGLHGFATATNDTSVILRKAPHKSVEAVIVELASVLALYADI